MSTHLLLAIILGFLAGVFARSFFLIGLAVAGFAALLAVTSFLFAYFETTKRNSLIVTAVVLAAFGAGIWRMNSAVLIGDPELTNKIETEIVVEGVISDEPDVRESNIRISLSAEKLLLPDGGVDVRAGVLVVAPRNTSVKYGDRVRAEGTLRLPQVFDVGPVRSLARASAPEGPLGQATSNGVGEGRQFNYPEYLAKDGIGYELAFAQVERLEGDNKGNVLKAGAIWIKQQFLRGLEQALPEPAGGLGGGITVGAKRGLGKELNDIFITVGLVHVLVLSGYNITIVINAVRFAFSRLPRLFYFSAAACIAVLFALMTGGAASSVRAALMAMIAVVGRTTGRLYFASRVLGIVALGMVVWNPFILAFDLGFQLSVLATLGLIWFTPVFSARLKWITEKFALREIAATTLGTQVAVLPLLLYQNGQLPLFSLPANLLALVAVPPAMAATAIASVGGLVAEPIATLVAFPAYVLLSYIIEVAKFFAALPFAAVSISAFSAWWMFLAYAVMFGGLVYKVRVRRGFSPVVPSAHAG